MSDAVERLKAALAGRYQVEEEIGQGGMAVVFLAQDLKHHRKVALKVLRSELAAILGSERFLKEIEVTANLQHPNILPLYDSGEADGFLFYVMPLVEGETLRERLDRDHQLPVEEAVSIAKSVSAALDYAHRHGVIHRDIKPSNILLHDGQALVSDFGIALAMRNAGGDTRLTETGLSIGTPHYMSPEQAAGDRELDARSDLYSLGAVTYEMLVGEPPHVAKTAQAVVAKILSDTPAPIRRTREFVPANVEAAVAVALARSPADRFASAADFAAALTNPGFTLPALAAAGTEGGPAAAVPWRWLGPVMTGVALVAAALAVWGWLRPEPRQEVARYSLAFPGDQEVLDVTLPTFSVAPAGAAIVYVGPGEETGQLWVKRRDQHVATPLPGTAGARSPSISPDGATVLFTAQGQLRKVSLQGGSAITLADSAVSYGMAWLDDGTAVFLDSTYRLRRVPAAGGPSELLWAEHPAARGALFPAPVPGSTGVLFTLCDAGCGTVRDIWVLDLRTGEARTLIPGGAMARYVNSGCVVFVRPDGAVFAAPFDPGALELRGTAVPLLEGVKVDGMTPDFALTPDGMVLMMEGAGVAPGGTEEVVWVSRDGVITQVDPGWLMDSARNLGWALSPDGGRLAIALTTEEGDDIWIKELDDGPLLRLTYDPAEEARPMWSLDGRSVFFLSRRRDQWSDLYVRRADGAGQARPVLVRDVQIWETDMTPDGAWLVARVGGQSGQTGARDIVAYRMEADTTEVPLLTSDYDEVAPQLSPDGRWLAYASQESGEWEVYVRPFPEVESGRWLVSRGGGSMPMWAHNGRELFYVSPGDEMTVAAVETEDGFRVRERRVLFGLPPGFSFSSLTTPYDLSPDDQRFIMVRTVGSGSVERAPLILVENWLAEVEAAVGR